VANRKYLPIYLNDHMAGSFVTVELARRVAAQNEGSSYGETLAALRDEIQEDRQTLAEVMKRLAVRGDKLKFAGSWVAEKAGRLKLNGEITRYSPLSRLEELEILQLGVEGKAALWRALRATLADDGRLRGVDFDELLKRATSQRRRLERLRQRAAAEALG